MMRENGAVLIALNGYSDEKVIIIEKMRESDPKYDTYKNYQLR